MAVTRAALTAFRKSDRFLRVVSEPSSKAKADIEGILVA